MVYKLKYFYKGIPDAEVIVSIWNIFLLLNGFIISILKEYKNKQCWGPNCWIIQIIESIKHIKGLLEHWSSSTAIPNLWNNIRCQKWPWPYISRKSIVKLRMQNESTQIQFMNWNLWNVGIILEGVKKDDL